MDDLLDDDIARELAERMKLFVFATDLPVSRLSRDMAEVERFETTAGPLTPAAAAIVDGAVRIRGRPSFLGGWRISRLGDGQGRPDCSN
ncbi:hypothetical protein [Paraburkholderia sp. BL9I2N2]|uniref:hypothetical protein n=1 Tax=Paraburkholderia sp. BL9I2N2 TaxID=1938809 RepID=UPI00104459CE|nr:hypothetical protein [Paraburkholderia sp. BL9I2N2]